MRGKFTRIHYDSTIARPAPAAAANSLGDELIFTRRSRSAFDVTLSRTGQDNLLIKQRNCQSRSIKYIADTVPILNLKRFVARAGDNIGILSTNFQIQLRNR